MFQLAENSVAQTAGRTVKGAPASDFFGNSTENRAIDIGAHQASNTIVSTYVKSVEQVSANTTAGEYPVLRLCTSCHLISCFWQEQIISATRGARSTELPAAAARTFGNSLPATASKEAHADG